MSEDLSFFIVTLSINSIHIAGVVVEEREKNQSQMLFKPYRCSKKIKGTKEEKTCDCRKENREEKLSCKGHMMGVIQLHYKHSES